MILISLKSDLFEFSVREFTPLSSLIARKSEFHIVHIVFLIKFYIRVHTLFLGIFHENWMYLHFQRGSEPCYKPHSWGLILL